MLPDTSSKARMKARMRLDISTVAAGLSGSMMHTLGLLDALGTFLLGAGTFIAATIALYRFICEQRRAKRARG